MEGRKRKFIRELQEKVRIRRESGLYTVDGPKMCSEIPADCIEELFVTESFLHSPNAGSCRELLERQRFELITEAEMKQISDTVSPQGILALCRQQCCRGIAGLMAQQTGKEPLLLLLETLQDPGNLGTIFRASEAAGVTGILMNETTCDVYSPKTVRSTMGSVFRVPFAVTGNLSAAAADLRDGKYTDGKKILLLSADLEGAVDYTAADYRGACAFMIGNESRGLSEELRCLADLRIRIPMCGRVESLNAAMAAAVIAFEAARQRRH